MKPPRPAHTAAATDRARHPAGQAAAEGRRASATGGLPDGTKARTHARRMAPLMPDDRDGRGYPPIGGFATD
jgi:hypothetical protein